MKSLTELTEAELLELIKDEPNTITVYDWANDVMEFISVYNLKSGEEQITTKLLYKLYRLWSKNPVTNAILTNTLTDLFPSRRNNANVIYILLDKSTLNLKEEAYKYIKKQDKSKNKKWLEHFYKFKHELCIEKGGLFIKDTVLYNIYDKWCYKKRSSVSIAQFNNFCKLHYNFKIIDRHYWFSLNESITKQLTENMIKEMSKPRALKKTIKKI